MSSIPPPHLACELSTQPGEGASTKMREVRSNPTSDHSDPIGKSARMGTLECHSQSRHHSAASVPSARHQRASQSSRHWMATRLERAAVRGPTRAPGRVDVRRPFGFTGTRFDLLPIAEHTARGIKCPHDRRGSPTAGDRPRLILRPRMAPHRATPQRQTHRYRQTRTIPRGLRIQSNPSTDTTSPPARGDRDTHFPRALITRSASS